MRTKAITVYESTLDKRKDDCIQRAKKLSGLLARYEEALSLLDDNEEELYKYLYYTSAKYIQRLDEPNMRICGKSYLRQRKMSSYRPLRSI